MKIFIADIAVGAYLLSGAANAAVAFHGYIDPFLVCKWAAMGAVYVILRMLTAKTRAKKFVLWTIVAAGSIQAVIATLQLAGILRSNHHIFSVTGSFGNPAQLGGFLAVAFVVLTALFFGARQVGAPADRKTVITRNLSLVSMALIVAGLGMADSRAAIVAVAVGMAVCFRESLERWLRRRWIIALPGVVVVLLISAAALYCYRPASADARLLIWRVSADMIADKPLFGHGIGSFSYQYMLWQARYFEGHSCPRFETVADNVAYPYNELLHVLIEQGIAGALILIVLFAAIFAHRPRDGTQRCIQTGLAAITAFSMFSYPADVFLLLLFFAIFAGLAESKTVISLPSLRWARWTAASGLVAICAVGVYEYTFYRTAQKNVKVLFRKDSIEAKAFIDTNYDKLKYSRSFSSLYALWLAEHPDIDRMLVLPPSCETYCDIGNAYTAAYRYSEAGHYYTIATQMIPTRLKPSYLRWKMELHRGDTLQAAQIGNTILSKPLKVENTFTLKAKAEVREFLKELK